MAVDLTLQNARTQIENALVNTLLLALGQRKWTVADIPSLRAVPTTSPVSAGGSGESVRDINDLAFVTVSGLTYQWSTSSTAPDDGVNVVQPTDNPSLPGRWLITASTVSQGYLLRCVLFNSDIDDEAMVNWVFAQTPAILISFEHASHKARSKIAGALYNYNATFKVLVVAQTMRGLQAARQGSDVGTEAQINPGTASMMGDVKQQLAGNDISGYVNDVQWVELGDEIPVVQSIANRRFIEELEVTVYATLTRIDQQPVANSEPYEFNVQEQLAGRPNQLTPAQAGSPNRLYPAPLPRPFGAPLPPSPSGGDVPFDPNNYVSSGMSVGLGSGLTQKVGAGTVIIGGATLNTTSFNQAFAANSATYRDLSPAGNYTFIQATIGSAPPPVTPGSLRIGVTITDASSVVLDVFLCDVLLNFGPANKVDPPTLVSIAVTPNPAIVGHGSTLQLTAIGTYSDGSTQDLTQGGLTWSSDTPAVATVTNYGLVTGIAPGSANITAALGAVVSPAVALTVT